MRNDGTGSSKRSAQSCAAPGVPGQAVPRALLGRRGGRGDERRRADVLGEAPVGAVALHSSARHARAGAGLCRRLAGRRRSGRRVHRGRRMGAAGAEREGSGAAGARHPRRGAAGWDPQAAEPRADTARRAPQPGARRGGDQVPLRRRQRVLRVVPRRNDDVQLRDLFEGRADAGGRAVRKARPGGEQARAESGSTPAGRRLRLGQLRDPRGQALRRDGHRRDAVALTGRARAREGRAGRPQRADRDQGLRLPRAAGRIVRRDREHRHVRARRREPDRQLRAGRCSRC